MVKHTMMYYEETKMPLTSGLKVAEGSDYDQNKLVDGFSKFTITWGAAYMFIPDKSALAYIAGS